MKKSTFAAFLILLLLIPVSAQASQRGVAVSPNIRFNGTTATCTVSVSGNNAKDAISLTAKLYCGSDCIATWTDSGTGRLSIVKTKSVQSGKNYKLTADVTINGTALATASTTGTCP